MNPIRCLALLTGFMLTATIMLFAQSASATKTEKKWYQITQTEVMMYKPRRAYRDWTGAWGFNHTVGYTFQERLNPGLGLGAGIEWWYFDTSDDRAFNPRFPLFTEFRLSVPGNNFKFGMAWGFGYTFWRRDDYLKIVGFPPGGPMVSINAQARIGRHFYEKIGIRLQRASHVNAQHFASDNAGSVFLACFNLALGYWW